MPVKKKLPDRSAHLGRLMKMMQPLEGLPEFTKFMEEIRDQREVVIEDLCNDGVVGNPALTAATIGELRTYCSILSLYQAKTEQQADNPQTE